MTGSLNLGDNYEIEENSNGNLLIKDSTGTVVLKHEDGTQDIETQSLSTKTVLSDPRLKEANITERSIVSTNAIKKSLSDGDSIQAAFDVIPFITQHQVTLDLDAGTYDTDTNIDTPVVLLNHPSGLTDADGNPQTNVFDMVGDASTPSNVVIDATNFDFAMRSPVLSRSQIRGVQFNCSPTNYAASVEYRECRLSPSNGQNHIGGHGQTLEIVSCRFVPDTGTTTGVNAFNMAEVYVNSCSGRVRGSLFDENDESRVVWADTNDVIGEFPDTYLFDDFRDGRLTDRASTRHRWQRFHPEWNTLNGTPSASRSNGGYLSLPAGDSTSQEVEHSGNTFSAGTYRIVFEVQSSTSFGNLLIRSSAGDDRLDLQILSDGDIRIQKTENGTTTTVISDFWDDDTAEHTVEMVVSEDHDGDGNPGYTLNYDGAELGTHQDSFFPKAGTAFQIKNFLDAGVRIKEITLE